MRQLLSLKLLSRRFSILKGNVTHQCPTPRPQLSEHIQLSLVNLRSLTGQSGPRKLHQAVVAWGADLEIGPHRTTIMLTYKTEKETIQYRIR